MTLLKEICSMLQQYKKQTNIGVGVGFLISVLSKVLAQQFAPPVPLVWMLSLVGVALIIWGCVGYAKGKGHSGYWGALGLLWILGFIILALFPDKHKEG
jgi:hypothetical protein